MKTNDGKSMACGLRNGGDAAALLCSVTASALRPGGMRLTERGISCCSFGTNPRLLDVGCGAGLTVIHLRDKHRFNVLGLDVSSSMLGAGLAESHSFPFIRGHAQELPLRGSILDGIFCECVLTLLQDPGQALREFARVLCPGGHLVLSDLYDRRDEAASSGDHAVGTGCLKGIRTRSSAESIIAGAGLRQLVWEDHTQCLKELAAQLILNGISPDAYPASLGIAAVGSTTESNVPPVRPGYYLLVAKKT